MNPRPAAGAPASEPDPACAFCRVARGTAPSHVVFQDSASIAFLDHRPLFAGHTLVIPRAHVPTLVDLPAELTAPLFATVQLLARAVERGFGADGSFVAVNNRVSQSVAHLHVHVVPRRHKDGLKGFFWPRGHYADDAQMAGVRDRLAAAVADLTTQRD